ncbi:MAG: hypothetical protein ACPHID_00635 [Thermoplasmatota archaeon]
MQRWQALIRAPPKSVFQFLYDVTLLEDYSNWKVTLLDDAVGEGFRWRESRFLAKRTWTMTAFDRRALTFTATCGDLSLTMAAKKGGPGSCNVQMRVEGPDAAVARFAKTDGDRLERLAALLNAS